MIDLLYDTSTDQVRLARAVTIKVKSDVPVRVTFSSAPSGPVSDVQIALGTQGASPSVLAFNDEFTQVSSTVWTAVLDASDSRLVNYMNGRKQDDVNAELVLSIDGERLVYPNNVITVQPNVIDGPTTSEGGPVYLTEGQILSGSTLNRSDITALTGGASNALDAIDTLGELTPGTLIAVDVDDAAALWRLRQLRLSSISVAAAAVVTTARAHGFTTGQTVTIGGSNSTPDIDGDRVVTVLSSTTFSVPVTTTVAGSAGYATPAEDAPAGLVRSDDFNASTNAVFWQSVL